MNTRTEDNIHDPSAREALLRTLKSFGSFLPMVAGILLLISLLNPLLSDYYGKIFTGNGFWDALIGAVAGSVSFGMPVTSYIIGGELRQAGVSLVAVTAFLLTWTTVGVAMLPLEAKYLGKRFAVYRNVINFIFAVIIAVIIAILL